MKKSICFNLISSILLLLSATSVNAESFWDLRGSYTTWPKWVHSMMIDSMDLQTGDFSGSGFYIPDPSYTWTISGTVSGSKFTSRLIYTGKYAGYWADWSVTINCDGEISKAFLDVDSNGYSDSFQIEGRATSVLGITCNNNAGPQPCETNQ